jgi:predicted Zn-dependent peptidase
MHLPRAEMNFPLEVEVFTLPNGLRVLLQEDHRTPLVAVNLWYHVGSRDDPPGRSGFAHLFEHLMFQGSRHVGPNEINRYLDRAGASTHNASTTTDRTNYYETVPANQLELALWLESDRMGFLLDRLDQSTFDREREVVKNERRQRYENASYGLVPVFVREALYPPDHPYHRPTIGNPADLDAATLDDVRRFFDKWYAPQNATLALVGDFDSTVVRAMIARYFGPIPGGAPIRRATPSPITLGRGKTLVVEAGVEVARVIFTWPAPVVFAKEHCALTALAVLLDGNDAGTLAGPIVKDRRLAHSFRADYEAHELAGTFEVAVTLHPGQSTDAVRALIERSVREIVNHEFPEEAVRRAVTGRLATLVFDLENVSSRANLLNFYDQSAGDPRFGAEMLRRYDALAPADLRATFGAVIARGHPVVTIVRPTAGAPRSGRLVRAE